MDIQHKDRSHLKSRLRGCDGMLRPLPNVIRVGVFISKRSFELYNKLLNHSGKENNIVVVYMLQWQYQHQHLNPYNDKHVIT